MNKICMSQTCLFNISSKKLPGFDQQKTVATEGYIPLYTSLAYNTNFTTVHSWATVGSCLVQYEYKMLCQFTMTHKVFLLISWNRTERQWLKSYWILPSNFVNKLRRTWNFFLKKKFVYVARACSDVVQIKSWYMAFLQGNLVLCLIIAKYPL